MAKPRKRSNLPYTQTRGVTSTQKAINKATGVDNSYNYNANKARDSAEAFYQAFMNNPMATDAEKAKMKRDMYNAKRRKSNGGTGG